MNSNFECYASDEDSDEYYRCKWCKSLFSPWYDTAGYYSFDVCVKCDESDRRENV